MPLVSEQPIFTIHSPLGDIQKLGNTPYGERRIINILGGTVEGPKLKGKVLPGGADWQIVRADGVVHLTARYTIETDSRRLILVNAEGYRHGPPEVMARLARDETVDPLALLFPHLHAVRDRRSGSRAGSTASWPSASAPAERGGADRGVRGAVSRVRRHSGRTK